MNEYQQKNIFLKKDRERQHALFDRDPIRYFELCNDTCVTPEDHGLYETGLLEVRMYQRN